jgi:hypothetical protein
MTDASFIELRYLKQLCREAMSSGEVGISMFLCASACKIISYDQENDWQNRKCKKKSFKLVCTLAGVSRHHQTSGDTNSSIKIYFSDTHF